MKRVMIDIGHGGKATGTFNNYAKEKDINLIVGLKVGEILSNVEGIEVKCTRYNDTTIELEDRCKIANLWNADVFVSIHHNASGNAMSGASGYEIIHSLNSTKGKELAYSVGVEFDKMGRDCRRIFTRESEIDKGKDYYYVIRHTNMPAVITEYGFMDTDDYEAFDTEDKLHEEASAIANGIYRYFYDIDIKKEPVKEHWAEEVYQSLLANGIKISEKRFDDCITRGEVFALLSQLIV